MLKFPLIIEHPRLDELPIRIESNRLLAQYFGLEEFLLIREDLLPDLGGKKRRSLATLAKALPSKQTVHVLSYAGSNTVHTLARLRRDCKIVSHGKIYSGGDFMQYAVDRLSERPNVIQKNGPLPGVLLSYFWAKYVIHRSHIYLKTGGRLASDDAYMTAAELVKSKIGGDYHHFLPVASGNLLEAVSGQFSQTTGILTQPWYIRIYAWLKFKRAAGFYESSIDIRIALVRDIFKNTNIALDPVFMGPVMVYLQRLVDKPKKVCLWVTCSGLAKDYHLTR